jgi:hypothetical protein
MTSAPICAVNIHALNSSRPQTEIDQWKLLFLFTIKNLGSLVLVVVVDLIVPAAGQSANEPRP